MIWLDSVCYKHPDGEQGGVKDRLRRIRSLTSAGIVFKARGWNKGNENKGAIQREIKKNEADTTALSAY